MSDDQLIPAGWYPDPEFPGNRRFWDGTGWTDDREPDPIAAASPPPPPTFRAAPPPPPHLAPADRTNAGLALAFSIIGIVFCQLFAPVGMVMGRNEMRRIDSGQGDPSARGLAQGAWIVGLIGTIILVAALVFLVLFFVVFAAGSS